MDLRAGADRLPAVPREHGADLLEADGRGDERPRIDGTARVRRDGARRGQESLTKRRPP